MPVVSKLYVCQGTNMAAMNMMKPTPPSAMSGGAENNDNAGQSLPLAVTGTVAVTKVLPCSQQRCQCVLGKCAARVKPFSMTRSTSASTLNGPIISWVLGTHVGTRKHNIY